MELLPVKLEDMETPAMLVRRQQHYNFQAALAMEFEPLRDGEEAGLVLTQNERFSFLLVKEIHRGKPRISCYRVVNGTRELIGCSEIGSGRVYLFVEGSEGRYDFYCGSKERDKRVVVLGADGSISLETDAAGGSLVNFDLDLVGCKQFLKVKVEMTCTGGSSPSCTATCALALGDKAYTPA